jgi:hypothetical protein
VSDYYVNKANDLDRLIASAVTTGAGHKAELLRAVRRGTIALVEPMDRDSIISMRMLKHISRPTLVIIGDDDYRSTGPAGWKCAKAMLRWSRWTCLHAAGVQVEQYRALVAATILHRRMMLVETSSAMLPAWSAALQAEQRIPRGLTVVPRDGAHPIVPAGDALQ